MRRERGDLVLLGQGEREVRGDAERVLPRGELVVRGGSLVRADEREIASAQRAQAARFAR